MCSNDDVVDDDELRPPYLTATMKDSPSDFLFVCKFSSVNFDMVDRRRRKTLPWFKKLHLET